MDTVEIGNFINGKECAPQQSSFLRTNTVPSIAIARSCTHDVTTAIESATQAQSYWLALSQQERMLQLRFVARQLEKHADYFSEKEALETGHSVACTHAHSIQLAINYLANPDALAAQTPRTKQKPEHTFAKQIIPATASSGHVIWRITSALLHGHSSIICLLYRGHQSLNPRNYELLTFIARYLPNGVLNIVNGLALEAGVALMNHPHGLTVQMKKPISTCPVTTAPATQPLTANAAKAKVIPLTGR